MDSNSIDEFINTFNNKKLISEISKVFDNNEIYNILEIDEPSECAKIYPTLQIPKPVGVYFFETFTSLQTSNLIIPDLFRSCFLLPPIIFQQSPCGLYPSCSLGVCPSFNAAANGLSINSYQKLPPKNIIKAFLYFGYSSFFDTKSSFNNLEDKIKAFKKNNIVVSLKSDNIKGIFNTIFNKNSLIQSLIDLNNNLSFIRNYEIDGTNFCNYNLNWLFTYYCYQITPTSLYTIFNSIISKQTTTLSYADMTYLNYVIDNLINDFDNFLSTSTFFLDNNPNIQENVFKELLIFISENNIKLLIDYALEVQTYIYGVIQSILNDKEYKREEYTTDIFYNMTETLYCNYVKNEVSINPNEFTVPSYCI
jgi:hypothetical protein